MKYQKIEANILNETINITQKNASAVLGGIIDSTKPHKVIGNVNWAGIQCTIPAGGMLIEGDSGGTSSLFNSEDGETLFVGANCGTVLTRDITLTASGVGSKVFDVVANDPLDSVQFRDVIFKDCSSIGEFSGFFQGTEFDTIRQGGTPTMIFSGTWAGGYLIETSIAFGLLDGAYSLFCSGTALSFGTRFKSNINATLTANNSLSDFTAADFLNPSGFQLQSTIVSRNGVFNASDPTITPGSAASDLSSKWKLNTGIGNTFEGGKLIVTAEATNVISDPAVYYDITGIMTPSELAHFDNPANGQLRHLGNSPVDYEVKADIPIRGDDGDVIHVKIVKWDDSAASFEDVYIQERVINNFTGGSDKAFFNIATYVVLDKNDYIKAQYRNTSDTSNITVENSSYLLLKER